MDWAVAGVKGAREVFLTWNRKCFYSLSINRLRRRVWKRASRTFQNFNEHLRVPLIKGIFKSFNFHKNIYVLPRRD